MKKYSRILIFGACAVFAVAASLLGQTIPKAGLPVLTTSAGQSTDVETLNVIMEAAEIKYDYCDVPTVELLASGVGLAGKQSAATGFHVEVNTDLAKFPAGTPYKAVIFAIGASLKGMGASGLTLDTEAARLKKLIAYCKQKKILVMAVHIGGEAKRGAPGGDNERMIDAVAPLADYLVVTKDSNKDGRFTKIAEKSKAQLSQVDYALGIVDLVKNMFN
ncbi:MAG: DUF6305 family protein [Candidatus Aminicenantales bacterium]